MYDSGSRLSTSTPSSGDNCVRYDQFTASRAQNGYMRIPIYGTTQSLLIQWGRCSSPGGDIYVSFPIAFTTAYMVMATDVGADRAPYGAEVASASQWLWDCPIGAHTAFFIAIGVINS
jgi:hypothetical protein